ncbi:hypothetical protein AGABI2DRAFT_183173 [Agaricus bisporus var. bisporus H97]|uniref:hypothetical protein n=1 Tax=Agaricus bisporus var. bisporus (strain H97 / ATCC MYA-4626 / FGSC 10389) TaxID=936046 RepID=UPI00029F5ED8|nr:hypothetical protein AGABI2DRAFT_183173 [Agaricus bisporus var. bisporus H97]EKV50039.1 hypothetical protein AGABI2DRAFT_183173 [Agaricus bisporus var. bisporus H97]
MLSRLARLRPSLVPQPRRTFVSPVLLSRTWENETVASLRKEARDRGLSAKGSKANLILRISEHEKRSMTPPTPPLPKQQRPADVRSMAHTVAPGPGVPPTAATSAPPPRHQLFNVAIPDLSQPDPEPPIEVPYVPDFWDSTTPEEKFASPEKVLPKIVVVGGLSTHPASGPLHNLDAVSEDETIDADATPPADKQSGSASAEPGLLEDITEDLGIPPPKELKQSLWKLFS